MKATRGAATAAGFVAGLLVAAVGLVAMEGAEAGDKAAKVPPPPGAAGADGPMKRKERIKAELGIDDATAVKLFAALDNHRRAMKPLKDEVDEIKAAVVEELAAKVPNDKRISELLARFEKNRRSAEADRWLLADSVKKILTPAQSARFLLFVMHKKMGG